MKSPRNLTQHLLSRTAPWLTLACLAVAALAAGQSASETPAPTDAAGPAEEVATPSSYLIGAADVLRIQVFGEPTLSGDFTVLPDGSAVLPLLGPVQLAGLGLDEATARLTRALEEDYLYDPKVSVEVKEYRSQKVEVLGAVARPGTFFLERPTRLVDVLSRAGGVLAGSTSVHRGQLVRVARPVAQGEPIMLQVDLFEALVEGSDNANILLQAGDVVFVPMTLEVHVVGEVKKPGSLPYEDGLTVLKAVSLAGGPTPAATLRKVIIRRIEDGQEVRIKAHMEDLLRPDDIVEVPLGFW